MILLFRYSIIDKLWPKGAAYKALTKDLGTTMNEQLNKLLTEHALSPKLKIVADYVVDHLQTCCFLSSSGYFLDERGLSRPKDTPKTA